MSDIRRVGVVGTGVIGASWTSVFLAHGLEVVATDPAPGAVDRLVAAIGTNWPTLRLLGAPEEPDLTLLHFTADTAATVSEVDYVQESGPELIDVKRELFAALDASAPPATVIASSSSGLRPSDIQSACAHHPERVLVGHPFNPVHLIPLVEVVGGAATSPDAVTRAIAFYTSLGKRPIHVRAEVPGHVANRLQAALWREAFSLVERGVASVTDIDVAISNGPGLRWAVLGPFVNQHLSGGPRGMAHCLAHLGPPMEQWWHDLGDPSLTPELTSLVVRGVDEELAGTQDASIAAARDRLVVGLLTAKANEGDLP